MARMSQLAGFDQVIGFDMGGTSTDVSHYAGEYERVFTTQVAGVRLRAPMLDIHTVAAGGGSVLHFDGSRYRVGPDSAGADPGPACYRRGGPLTVTDANVMLGRIQPAHFPDVFGPGGDQPLDDDVVRDRFAALAREIHATDRRRPHARAGRRGLPADRRGQHRQRGQADLRTEGPRRHRVRAHHLRRRGRPARVRGRRLARHPHRPGAADGRRPVRTRHRPRRHHGHARAVRRGAAGAGADARRPRDAPTTWRRRPAPNSSTRTSPSERIRVTRRAQLRYDGTDTALTVELTEPDTMTARLRRTPSRHVLLPDRPPDRRRSPLRRSHRSHRTPRPLRPRPAGAARRRAAAARDRPPPTPAAPGATCRSTAARTSAPGDTVDRPGDHHRGQRHDRRRRRLAGRDDTDGPPGHGTRRPPAESADVGTEADPVLLEVFNNLFMSIAEQMGARLESTAQSVNIKERLDFSCALFDPDGNLVANAPHIPVHLGSMGTSVKEVIRRRGATHAARATPTPSTTRTTAAPTCPTSP